MPFDAKQLYLLNERLLYLTLKPCVQIYVSLKVFKLEENSFVSEL